MAATTTPNYQQDETFEQFWASLKEIREMHKEITAHHKEITEQYKETTEEKKERDRILKETERMVMETSRQMGLLNNRFGELAEHLVAPSIMEKFNELGFNFDNRSLDHEIYEPGSKRIIAEIDILLENGDIAVAVEVKAKPDMKDVDEHIERMGLLRRRADKRQDMRKFRGAIAGAIMSENVRRYIIQSGMYLIEQTGDTVQITIPEGFTPRDF